MTNGRILIVESDAIVAWDLAESLEHAGYEVWTVRTGSEGLQEARKRRPELAIVDTHLAGSLDAAATAFRLHTDFLVSVVYLTALSRTERPVQLDAAAPVGFLEKPFTEAAVLAAADGALELHRALERSLELAITAASGRAKPSHTAIPTKLVADRFCLLARRGPLVPLIP